MERPRSALSDSYASNLPCLNTLAYYVIDVNCYEICCDRIFKRVSLYTNHKCEVPKAIIRRDDLKRESEKQLRQSLSRHETRPHLSKRRKIRRESFQRPQTIKVPPICSPGVPLDVGSMRNPVNHCSMSGTLLIIPHFRSNTYRMRLVIEWSFL